MPTYNTTGGGSYSSWYKPYGEQTKLRRNKFKLKQKVVCTQVLFSSMEKLGMTLRVIEFADMDDRFKGSDNLWHFTFNFEAVKGRR